MNKIVFQKELKLNPVEFRDVLIRSTLGERRPIDEPERIKSMCENANLIITARHNGKLIGVARSVTDFTYCTYLSDLAVDLEYQKKGIGVELIKETKRQTPHAKLILLSAPAAINYYPKIGMRKHDHCFFIDDINDLG
ncbi:MAG: GNAT family N-acetyltransferase [Ignavibacteriales bacterium]